MLKSGATPGACSPPGCTPTCKGDACGGDDGCNGICGCGQSAFCDGGVCKRCDVTDAAGLAAALQAGGSIVACPRRYGGNFTVSGAIVVLTCAGDGEDPASNTILDANGNGRVVEVGAGVSASLQGLRITGGKVSQGNSSGGGILNLGNLIVTDCTIDRNSAINGGGISNDTEGTSLTLERCTVSGNSAVQAGGGILSFRDMTIKSTAITGNAADNAGGVFVQTSTATFDSASSVIGNTCKTFGCAGGIVHSDDTGTVNLNNATVSGNTEPQCLNVPSCTG